MSPVHDDGLRLVVLGLLAWLASAALIDPFILAGADLSVWNAVATRALGVAALGGAYLALHRRDCTERCVWGVVVATGAALCLLAGVLAAATAVPASDRYVGPYGLLPAMLVVGIGAVMTPPWRIGLALTLIWLATYVTSLSVAASMTHHADPISVPRMIAFALALAMVLAAVVASGQRTRRLRLELFASRRLGDYRLMSPLGGGMSEVWLAWDEAHRREVALKLLRTPGTPESTRVRFAREVELVRTLRSPHMTRIYDVGVTDDGFAYIAFEYLRGMDLEALVNGFGPIEPSRAVHVFAQACRGLAVAHRVGVVHRDVKPANLHCSDHKGTEDHVHVLDFGVARSIGEGGVTMDGAAVGTPAYMPPEAFNGGSVTPASDVYSLGAALYFAVTGSPPFDGDAAADLRRAHLHAPLVPPSLRSIHEVPRALEKIILRCLAKQPAERFADAAELGDALERCGKQLAPWKRDDAARWWHRARAGRLATPAMTKDRTTEVEVIATPPPPA